MSVPSLVIVEWTRMLFFAWKTSASRCESLYAQRRTDLKPRYAENKTWGDHRGSFCRECIAKEWRMVSFLEIRYHEYELRKEENLLKICL